MTRRQIRQALFFLGAMLCVSLPKVAIAHVGGHSNIGFIDGFMHPLGGLDHLVAMLAVGIWAVQLGNPASKMPSERTCWAVPLAFLMLMLVGGILGMMGMALPGVELGIIVSDLLLGLFVLVSTRLPLVWSCAIVGFLALFHGYAHGAEIPANSQTIQYALGFLAATASLHLIGIGLATVAQQYHQRQFFRLAGGATMLAGLLVFAQSI